MSEQRLRAGVRALIVDHDDRVLLCRWDFARDGSVWGTPGGGIEPGETHLEALDRELREEVGLVLEAEPPHVWHQVVVAPGHVAGFDGVVNDVYLVRTPAFDPAGTHTVAQLKAENLHELRWWSVPDVVAYPGPAVFAPRDLGQRLSDLLAAGPPSTPVLLGL